MVIKKAINQDSRTGIKENVYCSKTIQNSHAKQNDNKRMKEINFKISQETKSFIEQKISKKYM